MNSESIRPGFERDGFVFPLKAMEESEARAYRQLLETVEADHGDNPDYVYAINGGVNFILPLVDGITARPEILDRVEDLLGPDIIVSCLGGAAAQPAGPYQIGDV